MLRKKMIGAAIVAAIGLLAGCGAKQQSETEKKLAETEKQLAEAQKKLDETAKAAPPASEPPSAPTTAAKTATRPASSSGGQTAKPAPSGGINPNMSEAEKKAIAENKRLAQEAGSKADEALRASAPAPYHTIPAGTTISVRTTSKLSSKTNKTGSIFEATLTEPLVDGGYTIAERGATVEGVVTNSDDGGRVKGVASMTVGLRAITMADGRRLPIRTGGRAVQAKKETKKDAMKVGIASGIGAAIGAIAGGGKGAAIGAGAGAAGGTGMVLGTKGAGAEIPAESELTFTLSSDVRVQERK